MNTEAVVAIAFMSVFGFFSILAVAYNANNGTFEVTCGFAQRAPVATLGGE